MSYQRPTHKTSEEPKDSRYCKRCGKIHDYGCAVEGCHRTGTITDSTSHECGGQARWVCGHHYRSN
jgi:hypothetical protein